MWDFLMAPEGILLGECVRRRKPNTICFHLVVGSIKVTQMSELGRDGPTQNKLIGDRGGDRAEKCIQ